MVLSQKKTFPISLWWKKFSEVAIIVDYGTTTVRKKRTILWLLVPQQDRSDTSFTWFPKNTVDGVETYSLSVFEGEPNGGKNNFYLFVVRVNTYPCKEESIYK